MTDIEKLIPMVDFVAEIDSLKYWDIDSKYEAILKYAEFLKQPLTLGMFVPVNSDGEVTEEPLKSDYASKPFNESGECKVYFDDLHIYNKAKENVLFEGFVLEYIFNPGGSFQIIKPNNTQQICIYKAQPDYFIWNFKTVEDISYRYELILTQTAKNLIYGT